MIDLHSHVLPGIDDGAKDVDISLEMLDICADTGIDTIVVTPHCHPTSQERIDRFIARRKEAAEKLNSAILASGKKYPKIVLASEVRIYDGFSKLEHLDELAIAGTDYILLEMPYEKWRYDTFDEIYNVVKLGFKPIMAHLDRFLDQSHLFGELYVLDLLYQINSSAFLDKTTRRKIAGFFENNSAHVIGSDTHNLTDRRPNAAEAYETVEKRFGKEYAEYLKENGRCILENKPVRNANFPKIGGLKKLML